MILERRPDVVLLDVHMPDGGGRAVVQRVAPQAPEVRFLALSVSDAAEDVIGVIRAGARGYVTKTISGPELADAIQRVADGDAVFSPRLAGFVLDAFAASPGPSADPELDQLTAREQEVLRLIARGYAYKAIAKELIDLGQDGGDPRVVRPPQAPALQPPRAHPLGQRAPDCLNSSPLGCRGVRCLIRRMVAVAQLVRAPDCGPGGRGFKSPRSPQGSASGKNVPCKRL